MRPFRRLWRCATKPISNEGGYVLPMVLVWSFVLIVEIGGLATYASGLARQARLHRERVQAFYFAEAAVQSAGAQTRLFLRESGRLPQAADFDAMVQNFPGLGGRYTYVQRSLAYEGGATPLQEIDEGDYAGLNAVIRLIRASAAVRPLVDGVPAVAVDQEFQIQSIPIFQFGVFYQNDLEILPGANMTFLGAVHTNSDLYVGVGSGSAPTLSFESSITSAGGIYHERKDGSSIGTGAVTIQDAAGDFQPMYDGSDWLDSRHDDWVQESQNRWGGKVKSRDHGVQSLNLPIANNVQPRAIIERRSVNDSAQMMEQKLDYRAHLRVIDGQALNAQGQTIELRYCTQNGTLLSDGTCTQGARVDPVTSASFYDAREQRTAVATEIDIAKLNDSPAFQSMVSANEGVVVYVSDQRDHGASNFGAVRLVNGSQLPASGATFVSENPMYVKGSYNSINKQPAGLVSDALTLLSPNWSDAASSGPLNGRVASNMTVNAAVMTGNTETQSGQYNGGFENIHRLLEKWSGKTLTYNGSVGVLYNSDSAVGDWGMSNVYSAPNRNWSFDPDLLDEDNSVPGFPSVYHVTAGVWSRE